MNIIRNTRLKKRITQKQLAEMVGVSQAYISKIESDDFVNVTIIEIIKLSKALSIDEIDNRLTKLMSNPTYEEACCYGDYKFSDDVFSTDVDVLAAKLTSDELKRFHVIRRLLIMNGIIKEELVDSAWCEGSVALAIEKKPEKELKHIQRYKRLVYLKKRIL